MKTIPLSATGRKNAGKFVALVDDSDYEWVSEYKWFARVKNLSSGIYVTAQRSICTNGTSFGVYLHRDIWERAYGPIPSHLQIDHIEPGEFAALDNRRSNLRLADRIQQQGNRRRSAGFEHEFKGVKRHSDDRWEARIVGSGRLRYLGIFGSAEDAARAYDAAALDYFGEFARLNFPLRGPA